MIRIPFSYLFLLLVVAMTPVDDADAGELLLFIGAFASGDDGAIHAYKLTVETGHLKLVHRTADDVDHPFFLALSSDRRFLYSIHAKKFGKGDREFVSAYEVVGSSGELKFLNRQPALGSAACYLDVDATGKTVVVANYLTGNVASFPVQENGALGKAASMIQHVGSSVNSERQKGPHAHSIVVSPGNRYVYAADLGLDQILGYQLDPKTGKLSPNRQAFVRTVPGGGPRHMTFHPNGKVLYVINEIFNSISVFDYDFRTGVLIERETVPTLPEGFDETSHTADLKVTPDGRFLYGTNRGHDSLAAYRVGDEGQLSLIEIVPSLGKGPQNLAVTPGGELLICANMAGEGNVAVFRIDGKTGKLTSVGEVTSMPSPTCIMIWK